MSLQRTTCSVFASNFHPERNYRESSWSQIQSKWFVWCEWVRLLRPGLFQTISIIELPACKRVRRSAPPWVCLCRIWDRTWTTSTWTLSSTNGPSPRTKLEWRCRSDLYQGAGQADLCNVWKYMEINNHPHAGFCDMRRRRQVSLELWHCSCKIWTPDFPNANRFSI